MGYIPHGAIDSIEFNYQEKNLIILFQIALLIRPQYLLFGSNSAALLSMSAKEIFRLIKEKQHIELL